MGQTYQGYVNSSLIDAYTMLCLIIHFTNYIEQ